MQIVGFVGPQGGGKTAATNHIKNQGYTVLEMRSAAVKECNKLGLDPNRANLLKMGTKLRKEYGMDYAAKYLTKVIEEQHLEKVVISGIRSNFEIEHFRKKFPGFKVLAITAPLDLRYERTKDRWPSKKVFIEREEEENTWGIAEGLAVADDILRNNGSEEEFLKKVDTWLSSQQR